MSGNFFKKNILLLFFTAILISLDVFALDEEEKLLLKNRYAFEVERYFTVLNNYSFFSAINVYENGNDCILDFYKNKNKQHISINPNMLDDDFRSINVMEYEKQGNFKYSNNHNYNKKELNGYYSYIFSFGQDSQFLMMPYLKLNSSIVVLDKYLLDSPLYNIKLGVSDINIGVYTLYNFLNFENSILFADILLSINFDYTRNLTIERKKGNYLLLKNIVSDFNVDFMIGFGYKTEFIISKLFGNLSFIPKISLLRVNKKMDSKNIIDSDDLNDYGGDIIANYNSVYLVPSFDLKINNMFKGILLSRAFNTLFIEFKYLVDVASNYENLYDKVKKDTIQSYFLHPSPLEGVDVSLGFGLNRKYFDYSISYYFNRKIIAFNFNLKF